MVCLVKTAAMASLVTMASPAQRVAAGRMGVPGPPGPKGDTGLQGPPGAGNVTHQQAQFTSSTVAGASVDTDFLDNHTQNLSCPADHPLGVRVTASSPHNFEPADVIRENWTRFLRRHCSGRESDAALACSARHRLRS